MGVNGKLPSGSRSGAGHVRPAGLCSGKAAPRQLKEELPSLIFAQGERLGAHHFSNLAALQKKSNLWSPPTSRTGWAKKLHCKKSKHKLTNVSTGHSEQPLCVWGVWQEKPQECVLARHAQRGRVEAWQPRKGSGVAAGALLGDFQL